MPPEGPSVNDSLPSLPEGRRWDFKSEKHNAADLVETVNGLTRTQNNISETVNGLSKSVTEISLSLTGMSAGATGLSASASGAGVSADGAKVSLGALAGGFTLAKADATAFKVDEKGYYFFGKQVVTWPWALDEKSSAALAEKRIGKLTPEKYRDKEAYEKARRITEQSPRPDTQKNAQKALGQYRKTVTKLLKEYERLDKADKDSKKKSADTDKVMKGMEKQAKELDSTLKKLPTSISGVTNAIGH
ncbi:hypothetical protein [Streptomyces luteireticuli]|uniref:hypothetical protein n=1 Tax=Streptomyces luteireticuli TaxID=173858 RepID=UPI003557C9D4